MNKFSSNLFLGTLELNRFRDSLDKEGFRELIKLMTSPGLLKLNSSLSWSNGLIQQGLDTPEGKKTIKVSGVEGVDKDGLHFVKESETRITIPSTNTWYWITVSHLYTNEEQGTFTIDTQGNLTGTGSSLLEIFRQLPNFPTKIKFLNTQYNTQEYEVLEVINNTSAVLNGSGWVYEEGLKIAIVGTFTPGIVVPEIDKYPFNFDYASVTLTEELDLNREPNGVEGKTFSLGRVKIIDNQLIIQDKRREIFSYNLNNSISEFFSLSSSNPLIGIESVKFTDTNGNNERNLVELAWSFRGSNWSVQTSNNILTLHGSSLGGIYKSVNDFSDGDFNGWRVYTESGTYSKVVTSVKVGNAINLLLDTLDIDNYSDDGGLTYLKQQVVVTPDCDFIELEFSSLGSENVSYREQFPINTPVGRMELLVYDYPSCKYTVKYRYLENSSYTSWLLIPSDQKYGYYQEVSFTATGQLKDSGLVRKKYKSSIEEDFIELTAYLNNLYYIKNRLDVNLEEITTLTFSTESSVVNLVPKVNSMYQFIDNSTFSNSTSTESFFVDLSTDSQFIKNGSRFILAISKDLSLGYKTISVTQGFLTEQDPGTILKVVNSRDAQLAKFNQALLYVEFVFDGIRWQTFQNYELPSLGEVRIFQGEVGSYFDNSGMGKTAGWYGFSICNGSNSTSDLSSIFQLEEGSTTNYKLLYTKRIF